MKNTTQTNPFGDEEEGILRDVLDVAKKKVQGDCDLSVNLEKYMDLLQRIDITEADSCLALNFAKAAVILEKTCYIYSTKIELLAGLVECLIIALKESAIRKKPKGSGDDVEAEDIDDDEAVEAQARSPKKGRKRGRKIRGDLDEEDFFEIDNHTGLAGKDMNQVCETDESSVLSLFLDPALTLFHKTKRERKRIQVVASNVGDKDESRLRDWVLTEDMMVVREMCTAAVLSDEYRFNGTLDDASPEHSFASIHGDDWDAPSSPQSLMSIQTPVPLYNDDGDDYIAEQRRLSSAFSEEYIVGHVNNKENCNPDQHLTTDNLIEAAKEKLGDIPSKKIRPGQTHRPQCNLCETKKTHSRKKKKCFAGKPIGTLDSYFFPFVQPTLGDIQLGVTPDVELFTLYKAEMKALMRSIENRPKVNLKNLRLPTPRGTKFTGFGLEDEKDADDDDMHDDRGDAMVSGHDFDLPLPNMELPPLPPPDDLVSPHSSDLLNIIDEMQEDNAQKCMERNKQLGIRTAAWHASLVDKIALSQKRGALNMDVLAGTIMDKLPAIPEQEPSSSHPLLSFQSLVSGQDIKDIPRFFLTCLQLTNEGNISIEKSRPNPIDPQCIQLSKLRNTRVRLELDEYTTEPQQGPSRPKGKRTHAETGADTAGKKRQRQEDSASDDDSETQKKWKGKRKQKQPKGMRM